MHYVLVGISHKTAPVAVREKVALNEAQTRETLVRLKGYTVIDEAVVLSTCNRTELYVATQSPRHAELILCEFFKESFEPSESTAQYFYRAQDREVIAHLFAVAASLDSQVVGESQITGQVKRALQLSLDQQAVGVLLKPLFETALFVAGRVRTETEIGKGCVSIGSVAVQLTKQIFGSLVDKTVVLIGAGEVGKLVVKYLNGEKVKETCVVNRTLARARLLEEQGLGTAYPIRELIPLVQRADVLITSVDGRIEDLPPDTLNHISRQRGQRPLLVIDLGVPRNFSDSTLSLTHHRIYNLDDLQGIANQNHQQRAKAIDRAKKLVDREGDVFYETLHFQRKKSSSYADLIEQSVATRGETHGREKSHQKIS